MLENLIQQLTTVAVGLGILGGAYLVWFISGIANVMFTPGRKWSWKRMFEDITKALLMSIAMLAWVAIFNALDWFSLKMGADISKILEGANVTGLIGGIIGGTVYFVVKGYKNFYEFINKNHVEPEIKEGAQDYKAVAEAVFQLFETRPEVVKAQKEAEEKYIQDGGVGNHYVIPIGTYQAFRDAVIGRKFDLDQSYGAQCWDGACLLWEQLGRWLYTGNGCAYGCWTLERDRNAGIDFELIWDKRDIKRGDVIVFGCGEYGHIGFADEDYSGKDYIRLLGQNQSPDMAFCVVNMALGSFLGAFRFKKWEVIPDPTPEPIPEPSDDVITYIYKAGDTFGQVIVDLGLKTSHGLWGPDGDVAYYTNQLGIVGNIPIGTELHFKPRRD